MARKKKHPEHVNHERWLVSYADFITLLFATFTALFAMSKADLAKWEAAAKSINQAFKSGAGSVISGPSVFTEGGGSVDSPLNIIIFPKTEIQTPPPRPVKKTAQNDDELLPGIPRSKDGADDEDADGAANLSQAAASPTPTATATPNAPADPGTSIVGEGNASAALAAQIKILLAGAGLAGIIDVRRETRGTVISLGEAAFFAPGAVEVQPQSSDQLDKLINLLRNKNYEIRIEGHTDNMPITSGRYRNNWELSSLRAARILDFMVREYHFPGEMLSCAGYGESRPIADNSTNVGRQKNRRVDIVILNQRAAAQEPH